MAKQLVDLELGSLFSFTYDRNRIWVLEDVVTLKGSDIVDFCKIKSALQKMNYKWTLAPGQEGNGRANPYANVHVMKMELTVTEAE